MFPVVLGFTALVAAEAIGICKMSQVAQESCSPASPQLEAYVRFIARQMDLPHADTIPVLLNTVGNAFTGGLGLPGCGQFVSLSRTSLSSFENPLVVTSRAVVLLNGEPVDPDSELSRVLWKSRPARRSLAFTVAHELAHVRHRDSLTRCVAGGAITTAWMVGLSAGLRRADAWIKGRFSSGAAVKVVGLRVGLWGSGFLVGLAGFFKIRSMVTQFHERRADRFAAEFSRKAAIGGLDFFRGKVELADYMTTHMGYDNHVANRARQFFASHPEVHDRAETLRKISEEHEFPKEDPLDGLEVYEDAIIDGLRGGNLHWLAVAPWDQEALFPRGE